MAQILPIAYFRDKFVLFEEANVSVASSPVLYGLGIYTVFGVFKNARTKGLSIFRLEDHYKRLVKSAQIVDFDTFAKEWPFDKFQKTMLELIKKNKVSDDSLVRVFVFIDEILAGTKMRGLKNSLAAFVYPLTELLPRTGCNLMISSWQRTPDKAIPPRAKITGNYVNSSLIKNEAIAKGFDDAVALDGQGNVTESSVANIFLVKDKRLITPNAEADILDGITCDSLLAIAKNLGIPFERRVVMKEELFEADEILLCGSSALVSPVSSIDRHIIGNGQPGPMTKQLMQEYELIVHGEADHYTNWHLAV